jgi:hypothetical protein
MARSTMVVGYADLVRWRRTSSIDRDRVSR